MTQRNTHNPAGLFDALIVDNFAGGGGASLGIERALGRGVDVAINHDAEAIAMHRANHPHTWHYTADVFDVDPVEATNGKPVALAWFSPDCKHFSKAKGGKPVSKRVRGLAWVVLRWASKVRPRVIVLENVEEFTTWGPLRRDGRPCPKRKGETFRQWTGHLRKLGYDVQWKQLRACDYGAPTIRKRFFLIARCDGQPIQWPEATHGDVPHLHVGPRRTGVGASWNSQQMGDEKQASRVAKRGVERRFSEGRENQRRRRRAENATNALNPYRTAADCIDWDEPCPSIFDRKKPLAKNTGTRLANGIKRYVIEAADPFLIATNHGDSGGRRTYPINEPMRTVQASCRGSEALCIPYIRQYNGEASHQDQRGQRADQPLTTVATSNRHALIAAFLSRIGQTGGNGHYTNDAREPLTTATTKAEHCLAASHLTHFYTSNTNGGQGGVRQPMKTVTATGQHAGLVAALLAPYYGSGSGTTGRDPREPAPTIPTKDRLQLVTAALEQGGTDDLPAGFWRVWRFLIEHLGDDAPAPAIVLEGQIWLITDIGMRMLQPRELYAAQGFPPEYIHTCGIDERGERIDLTKTAQVRLCGNSVCPQLAEAIVGANVREMGIDIFRTNTRKVQANA